MSLENSFASRHVARFLVSLVLYSHEINNSRTIEYIADKMKKSYLEKELFIESDKLYDQLDYHPIDENLFSILLKLYKENFTRVEGTIKQNLIEKYNFVRLDKVIQSILKLATTELLFCGDVPARIIIDEYVSITKTFYNNSEAGFVNKVIDTIAREVRKGEISE